MANKCPVCFDDLTEKDKGTPDACGHLFCLSCLEKWSQFENYCPIDRKKYRRIQNLQSSEYIRIKASKRKRPKARYDVSTFCERCKSKKSAATMLLCDSCDLAYHMHCLIPQLESIPESNWFCPMCVEVDERLKKRRLSQVTEKVHASYICTQQSILNDSKLQSQPKIILKKISLKNVPSTSKFFSDDDIACGADLDICDGSKDSSLKSMFKDDTSTEKLKDIQEKMRFSVFKELDEDSKSKEQYCKLNVASTSGQSDLAEKFYTLCIANVCVRKSVKKNDKKKNQEKPLSRKLSARIQQQKSAKKIKRYFKDVHHCDFKPNSSASKSNSLIRELKKIEKRNWKLKHLHVAKKHCPACDYAKR